MEKELIIGVDLGGTKVKSARINGQNIEQTHVQPVSSEGTQQEVIAEVVEAIERVWQDDVDGIGIGVPSVVDVQHGIVYDVQNIPSWTEVPLKDILEKKFGVTVNVNNDANCFALGEKYFGEGSGYANMVGLIIGTGMAAGIIVDGKLYNGFNCGAGEFGMIPYMEHHYEYYCSGQFFENVHRETGQLIFERAEKGDAGALRIFGEYGFHLANGIIAVLYALDPEVIILGGSVSKAYSFFQKSMVTQLQTFAYRSVLEHLEIRISSNPDVAVLGAAALHYNARLLQANK